MNDNTIIQLVIVLTVLFIIINYFVVANKDNDIINDVINYKNSDEDDETIYELEEIKSIYLKTRFKNIMIRGCVFGIISFIAIKYFTSQTKQVVTIQPYSFNYIVDDKPVPIQPNNFFNDAPW